MKIFESLAMLEKFVNPVLTIGNYDGFHLGHRTIVDRVKEKAAQCAGTSMLLTFQPHPLSVLKPDGFLGLITPLQVKKRLIEEAGVDVLLLLPFAEELRSMSGEAFVKDLLVGRIGIKGLVVGYDFRFGREGKGDVKALKRYSELYGFEFEQVNAVTVDHDKVGSNHIRKLIREGEIAKANSLLGRPYMIEGIVARGMGRGRDMGFPTLNLETTFDIIPKRGVYVSAVAIHGKKWPSVTNIGYDPTFDGKTLTIETYILNFSEDLYGREVTLYFCERIRDEVKFASVAELERRIALDVQAARRYFEKMNSASVDLKVQGP
jgi:riboflavin kinase / FMN adenylyltransferase